jgi:hypothetical protein
MEAAAAALLGAVVGGLVTLAATLFVELRRDRRRQMSSARLVAAELERSEIELDVQVDTAEEDWLEHLAISTDVWRTEAAYFVGALSADEFRKVDLVARRVHHVREFGATRGDAAELVNDLRDAEKIVRPLTKIRWVDRRVWRL